jgi:hypothetical protein
MRKETHNIATAFSRGLSARGARTETDGTHVWLHGNLIAWRKPGGTICFTLAGWPTVTTRERLNGLLVILGYGAEFGVYQRKGRQWLCRVGMDDIEIGDDEVFTTDCLNMYRREVA